MEEAGDLMSDLGAKYEEALLQWSRSVRERMDDAFFDAVTTPEGTLPLAVIRFCAEEVERQRDEPTAVWWLCQAWHEAIRRRALDPTLTVGIVEDLGRLVVPGLNAGGFRQGSVRVGSHVAPHPTEILPALVKLFSPETLATLTPDVVYYHFELIHPFNDGNGRVGKIILSWLSDSLKAPVMPSNWFQCTNP